jgi:tRNA 5-methylaminomethyl-2-thiouridine biosynthesis bifunctional protein
VAELKPLADQLLGQYVAIHQGSSASLAHGRVTLTLLIGDALEQLPQLDAQIDAWFLDGFAPAKTPTCGPLNCSPNWHAWLPRARPSAPSPAPVGSAACSMPPASR